MAYGPLCTLIGQGVSNCRPTAGADKGKLEEAKTRIENALMGMAVLAGTIAIALFLQWTFGFDLLNPTLPSTP